MTGMDTLTQDWGTKWNRIKSAALSNSGSGNSGLSLDKPIACVPVQRTSLVGETLPGQVAADHVNFTDAAGLKWSYPLTIQGKDLSSQTMGGDSVSSSWKTDTTVKHLTTGSSGTNWSHDASHSDNQALGNKTATQLCEALGTGWRLPTLTELQNAALSARANGAVQLNQYRWSNTDSPSNPANTYIVRWSDGYTYDRTKIFQHLVSCVK